MAQALGGLTPRTQQAWLEAPLWPLQSWMDGHGEGVVIDQPGPDRVGGLGWGNSGQPLFPKTLRSCSVLTVTL